MRHGMNGQKERLLAQMIMVILDMQIGGITVAVIAIMGQSFNLHTVLNVAVK